MAAQIPNTAEDAALSLTMAVVTSSHGPLLLLDGNFILVAASTSFLEAFEVDPDAALGRRVFDLGAGEWDVRQLQSLLRATASGAANIEAYEFELKRPGRDTRCLVIHAQRMVYLDLDELRLLVTITDVTDARADAKAKDEALRQNLTLLQEVRHRVANSLQIIASVLLQNARRTQSDETRSHLRDAHHRVMSVAALERQLSVTGEVDVELHAYFTELCDSIGASMIGDPAQISLVVHGERGVVNARVSVSLGLIVTELVINALKHAFPDGKVGKIIVHCAFRGPNWKLTVCDDGVGMPDMTQTRTGLGTGIVEALAKQLDAVVLSEPGNPGTHVSITHTRIALTDRGEGAPSEPEARWA